MMLIRDIKMTDIQGKVLYNTLKIFDVSHERAKRAS